MNKHLEPRIHQNFVATLRNSLLLRAACALFWQILNLNLRIQN